MVSNLLRGESSLQSVPPLSLSGIELITRHKTFFIIFSHSWNHYSRFEWLNQEAIAPIIAPAADKSAFAKVSARQDWVWLGLFWPSVHFHFLAVIRCFYCDYKHLTFRKIGFVLHNSCLWLVASTFAEVATVDKRGPWLVARGLDSI